MTACKLAPVADKLTGAGSRLISVENSYYRYCFTNEALSVVYECYNDKKCLPFTSTMHTIIIFAHWAIINLDTYGQSQALSVQ